MQSLAERASQGGIMLKIYAALYQLDLRIGRVLPWIRKSTPPSVRTQRLFAIILLACQTGITFTGSVVRVTGSGLGCDTWPQCHPGSFFPVRGAAPWVHQLIEHGNRLLTFVLIIAAALAFIMVLRATRRTTILHLAFLQGIGIIVQAVLGGISVHMDLMWWTVAMHFLPSMLLVFFAAVLVVKISEPDDGTQQAMMPRALRLLTSGSAIALAVVLSTGTLVTGAGPHAGDEAITAEHRLQIPLAEIAHIHAHSMYLYLGITIGLLAGLVAVRVDSPLRKAASLLILAIVLQGVVGIIQYWMGVPRWTVPLHVIGSGIVTLATGFVWGMRWRRVGGSAQRTGSVEGDRAVEAHFDAR